MLNKITCTILLSCLLTGCSVIPTAKHEAVVTVNGQAISQLELDTRYQQMVHSMALNPETLTQVGTTSLSDVFKRLSLDALVTEAIIKQYAEKHNIKVSADEINNRYNEEKKAHQLFFSTIDFDKKLEKLGYTVETFKSQLAIQLLKEKVASALAKASGKSLNPTPAVIQAYYQSHRSLYDTPKMVHVKHILITANMNEAEKNYRRQNPNASEMQVVVAVNDILSAQRAQANQILLETLKNPDSFDDYARKFSSDSFTASDGGDLGYISRDMMPNRFSKAVFSAPQNQIYPRVLQTEFGFHIAKVLDSKNAKTANFDAIKPMLQQKLYEDAVEITLKQWLLQQQKQSQIVYSPGYQYESQLHQLEQSMKDAAAQKEKQLENEIKAKPLILDATDKD